MMSYIATAWYVGLVLREPSCCLSMSPVKFTMGGCQVTARMHAGDTPDSPLTHTGTQALVQGHPNISSPPLFVIMFSMNRSCTSPNTTRSPPRRSVIFATHHCTRFFGGRGVTTALWPKHGQKQQTVR